VWYSSTNNILRSGNIYETDAKCLWRYIYSKASSWTFYYSETGVISKIVRIKHSWLALKGLFQRICKWRKERLNAISDMEAPPPSPHPGRPDLSEKPAAKIREKRTKTEQHKRKQKFGIRNLFSISDYKTEVVHIAILSLSRYIFVIFAFVQKL
jgi:hypothetical protein